MAEISNDFLAETLRRIQADSGDLKLDVRGIRAHVGHLEGQMARLSTRIDRRDETVEHILRRLDLREAHPAPSA